MKKLEDMTEPELRDYMNATGRAIEATAVQCGVEKPLFALVLFNDPKIGQYIANCDRADCIMALRETADRLERKQDVPRRDPCPKCRGRGSWPNGQPCLDCQGVGY